MACTAHMFGSRRLPRTSAGRSSCLSWENLSPRQKTLVVLLASIFVVVYFATAPSASWNYEYTSADDIARTMVSAPTDHDMTVKLPFCPLMPPDLPVSAIYVNLNVDDAALQELSVDSDDQSRILLGGAWRPRDCTSRHRVAIIVPYRNRKLHLKIFLNHMHRFLRRQQLDYRIIIVDQNDTNPFNRAALLNIGFDASLKLYQFDCFIFHDVDLLPEVPANVYTCSTSPRHMSVAINSMRYNLPYRNIFGGVTAMTKDQFETVNGYSNCFFGWGGEDDDLFNRIITKGLKIMRWDPKISRYYMIYHLKDKPNPNRHALLRDGHLRYEQDGLFNLTHKTVDIQELDLCTLISVQLDDLKENCNLLLINQI